MSEYLKENEHPVNQVAKKVLKNPAPDVLYCFQAADEVIKESLVKLDRRISYELQLNLEHLMYVWNPKNAMKFLLVPEGEDWEHDLIGDMPKNPDLEDVAVAVIEQLHDQLTAKVEGYP